MKITPSLLGLRSDYESKILFSEKMQNMNVYKGEIRCYQQEML